MKKTQHHDRGLYTQKQPKVAVPNLSSGKSNYRPEMACITPVNHAQVMACIYIHLSALQYQVGGQVSVIGADGWPTAL